MDFKTYQTNANSTALYPRQGNNLIYPVLGLIGEAGEIANKVKKIERDQGGVLSEETKKQLASELGDVLWYVSQVARELGLTIEQIAEENIDKLQSRKKRGTLRGDGDNR